MVWYDGFEGKKVLTVPNSEIDEFRIDYFSFMPDINRKNNTISCKGLFKKVEPIKLSLLGALDNPQKTQLFYTPLLGYNNYNGLMVGGAIYNHLIFQKKIEVELMPLYGIKNNSLAGYGKIQYNISPKKYVRNIAIGAQTARFTYDDEPFNQNYLKIAPYVNVEFKNKNAREKIMQQLTYRVVVIDKQAYTYGYDSFDSTYKPKRESVYYTVNDFNYSYLNKRIINPFNIKLNTQFYLKNRDEMLKASVTFNYSLTVNKKKSFDIRLFAGKMFLRSDQYDFRFRLSGQTGYQDYLFDNVYFGRSASLPNIGFQQFTENDGAFKAWTPRGQSDDWIVSLNLKSPTLFKIPLFFYADAGVYHTKGLSENAEFLYSVGVGIPVIKNFITIYIPAINSQKITDSQNLNLTLSGNDKVRFIDTIRFTFNLSEANPFNFVKNNLPF
jgi:hypothetical protein